jgi:hypothetical protein
VDWLDPRLRQIYWDDAHHLDRPEALRDALRHAAFYKINGFVIKLEGHFQYNSTPAIVMPCALSPAELQSLTDYGLKRHVLKANGRQFLHELDDVKDHASDRTMDLSYMIQRELLLPFADWVNQARAARNQCAQAHIMPLNNQSLDWRDNNNAQ